MLEIMGAFSGVRFMIRAEDIVKIAPAAAPYAGQLVRQMAESGTMANVRRASMFLGQVHHESLGFARVKENMNYSAKRMAEVWPGRYAINPQAKEKDRLPNDRAKAIGGNPVAIANDTYGGRMGNDQHGDGWKYVGRSLKMLTGKEGYRKMSRAWLGDESLLLRPERLEQPDGAVAAAIWYWVANGLNEIADTGSHEDVTRKIQGGQLGLKERKALSERYAKLWQPNRHNHLRGTAI